MQPRSCKAILTIISNLNLRRFYLCLKQHRVRDLCLCERFYCETPPSWELLSLSPEPPSCLSSTPPNLHADTFENDWYLFPIDHLLKQKKYFTDWLFFLIGFWRAVLGRMIEDRTQLSDRKDICTQKVFFLMSEMIPVIQAHILLTELPSHYRSRVKNLCGEADLARFLWLRAAELWHCCNAMYVHPVFEVRVRAQEQNVIFQNLSCCLSIRTWEISAYFVFFQACDRCIGVASNRYSLVGLYISVVPMEILHL